MIVAGTGHRPTKLVLHETHAYQDWVHNGLARIALDLIEDIEPSEVVSGMALGWDQALAHAALEANVPLVAAIPCAGQEGLWPTRAQMFYRQLLDGATHIETVSPGHYTPKKMHVRNQWMADRADTLWALWDGQKRGGTWNCINYAKRQGVEIKNIWSRWLKMRAHFAVR